MHGLISLSVLSAVPYSCLLFKICTAYADAGWLLLMYRICSLCLVAIGQPDCPTYLSPQVLHIISYIPLGFSLLVLCVSCLYIVFRALKAMLISVFLNRLVILLTSGL